MARTRPRQNAAAADASAPKTTRPAAASRRAPPAEAPARRKGKPVLDAMPDRIDIRDWPYQPKLGPLPDRMVNCDLVPAILDQGQEGACTGFALAAVVNYLLARRADGGAPEPRLPVSPRMLYEMARCYDEWPGEHYEGSSARGGMLGWARHGACPAAMWPKTRHGRKHLTPEIAEAARQVPGGAFYRVSHREIRDMHAALAEVGILYCTLMVHDGWFAPGPERVAVAYRQAGAERTRRLPVIRRDGRADSGHAVAIVGYTAEGFVIQNSWGEDWGDGGFALLPYEDYLMHATDVWVAQLGVPVKVDLWARGGADTTKGLARAMPAIPLADIRPFVIDVANNGELSSSGDYWTTESDLQRLFRETIPKATEGWKRRRVMLYLHGGLNDEQAAARRVVAFRDVLLRNEIYPLHVMWESGAADAIRDIIADVLTGADARAGNAVADWLKSMRDGLVEGKDRSLELTVAGPGGALWREMKENARLSSEHRRKIGAMQLMAKHAQAAMQALPAAARAGWELHVVAHSAGSIYAAHALPQLAASGIALRSLHLMAPAITVELFKATMLPAIRAGTCPVPDLYVLSDVGERDDDVGPYGKSLLYLVSNAFEPRRDTPLLGMERWVRQVPKSPAPDAEVAALLRQTLVVAGAPARGSLGPSRSDSHGGFDNDPDTLNSILRRILGAAPKPGFETRDLQY
ncbi:C1 family peptidase [Paracraurococcus ruber]|uniref:Peptidase C1A papain C-terminal domain-containing protein n=1 Tax=Paracraurococcus ruber TaxID=77675 RepID=A0ABS1CRV7_9PROT|nr:C1 family peptidase [Paracraurococcus ruber]MBK1657191.1 hypothetical protein [Paracraurococcus ruber]TDG21933.1 peptidase C1 [Paracraurococcus ruber]